jgi:NAD(P)-dependent dehydrogenase (short-subunit alcohol dehydrogenase family)
MGTSMVWGASGGIGRALVQRLISDGWRVWAVARDTSGLQSITPHCVRADVSKPADIQQAVVTAGQEGAEIDLWAYTVGDIAALSVAEMTPQVWKRILDANLNGAYLAVHYSLPLLTTNAHIFFVGAVSERMRLPRLSAYAAAKAGLEGFAEALRKEQRKRRVTVVRPKAVDTPFWEKVPFKLPPHAPGPETVADRIVAAYQERHKGALDL